MSDRPFAVGFLFGVFPVLLSYLNVGLDCINLAQVFLHVLNSDRHQLCTFVWAEKPCIRINNMNR